MRQDFEPSSNAALHLRRLLVLRSVVAIGLASAVGFSVFVLEMSLPYLPLASVLAATLVVTTIAAWRLRFAGPVTDIELFVHLVFDVAMLTLVLYCTGGSTNPFAPLYLVPLTFAATILSGRFAWTLLAVTAALYSLLLWVYVPLPTGHSGHSDAFQLHVLGMWLGFLLGAILIVHFAVRMRDRDRLLVHLREQALRHERVLALGTLATGAAHELATPLSTMAITVGEMTREAAAPFARLEILRTQIARCKQILALLSVNAGQSRAEGGQPAPLDRYLEQVLARFKSTRTQATVRVHFSDTQPAPTIVTEETLSQAILNIIANAADVSSTDIEFNARWTEQELTIDVCDRGPGLLPAALEHVGEPFFTTKPAGEGMGLGLFLARGTFERLGGSLELANRSGGGAVCTVRLPLRQLLVNSS